jgi:phasin family protein
MRKSEMADTHNDTKAPAKAETAAAQPAKAAEAATAKAAPAAAKAAAPAKAKRAGKPRRAAAARKPNRAKPARAAAARTATRTMNEGTRTMKNETNKVAERVQAAFGDVNERAKSAMERNTRFAEELTELSRGNVEALVASTKVAARGLETIGQEVAEFGRKSFEDASAALRGFAEVKSPADFFRLQTEFARSQFDNMVAETSKLSETMIKLAGDVAEPMTNRATVAAERVRAAVAV